MRDSAIGRGMAFLLSVVLAAFSSSAAAQAAVWTVSEEGEGIPERVEPGYTEFELMNDGDETFTVAIFQLHEGVALEEFQVALEGIDAAFMDMEAGDPVAAINAALEMADVVGEFDAEPGATGRMGVVLEAGEYVMDGTPDETGPSARVYRTFTVEGEASAEEAPEADATVQFVDFAFAMPPDILAGEQTWQVVNAGLQLHHMIVIRLNEGSTVEDVMAWLETEEGEPPGEPAAYVGILSPGRESFHTVSLEPGEHVAICFMPDHRGNATGQPHVALGMVQAFVVGE